ncbi:hypothetical protein M2158_009606 [Streptomyces sp. SAI-144]|uniref:hypothetical protein n=1 Tax=Streptomyces sp. SAI-144 TaxID=2940544 RepID=UPI002474393F|nr:hypothetical protein [Streptomyces sp. SAI-144]MDH6441065.1 hypothetical protein [Streptomyces sp. SAI-144]
MRPTGSKLDPTEAELWSAQSAAWESGTYALNVTEADAADLTEGTGQLRHTVVDRRGSPWIAVDRRGSP